MSTQRYDVLTLGETMIRLTPPSMERIETTRQFDLHVGGSESNTAVGLARLGMKTAWLSRLTDNALGHMITNTLSGFGVDTSHVIWTNEDRIGTYYFEPAVAPRSSRVIYDRAHSAFSKITANDLPLGLFQAAGARLLHLTGITPAVGVIEAAHQALRLAQQAGWAISFDMNYRAKLWTAERALTICEPFIAAADIFLISLNDVRILFGNATSGEDALKMLTARYPKPLIVVTMGSLGAMARTRDGEMLQQGIFPSHEIGRLGRGDSFSAGFLYGYLKTEGTDAALALRWGAACAALKGTIPGDLALFEFAEVQALAEQQGNTPQSLQR